MSISLERYARNIPALTEDEQHRLCRSRIAVIGCGGLGGYIIDTMARAGTGHITAADPDRFTVSNLNRQLLCTEETLGMNKAEAAAEHVRKVNPSVEVTVFADSFRADNSGEILSGTDVVFDALDSIEDRLLLEDECAKLGIPIVHGAVSGWNGQVSVVLPGSGLLHRLYEGKSGTAGKISVPGFTAQITAGFQTAEAVKLLCGRSSALAGRVLFMDLAVPDFVTLDIV